MLLHQCQALDPLALLWSVAQWICPHLCRCLVAWFEWTHLGCRMCHLSSLLLHQSLLSLWWSLFQQLDLMCLLCPSKLFGFFHLPLSLALIFPHFFCTKNMNASIAFCPLFLGECLGVNWFKTQSFVQLQSFLSCSFLGSSRETSSLLSSDCMSEWMSSLSVQLSPGQRCTCQWFWLWPLGDCLACLRHLRVTQKIGFGPFSCGPS